MVDLSRPWPLGLDDKRWWLPVLGALALLGLAVAVDRPVSVWAQGWPSPVRDALAQITPYGESGWILIPAGVLFVVTAAIALFMRWRLMRTMLWQFTSLYAFIFIGVGLPSLVATLAKRLIGRPRPMQFDASGLFGLRINWFDMTYQSFPSGHATTAFALAATIGFISPRWFWPSMALAAVIGVSRVSGGLHYPSDVVGGAILGVAGAYYVRWLFVGRGWLFDRDGKGGIEMRPMSSLQRYLAIKKRDIAPKRQPDRP